VPYRATATPGAERNLCSLVFFGFIPWVLGQFKAQRG
jgi:hypothetical protein